MERYEKENFIDYAERVTNALAKNEISYQEWSQDIIGSVPYEIETLRRCKVWFTKFLEELHEDETSELSQDSITRLKKIKAELEKERQKISDEKREQKEIVRQIAIGELFNERIENAILALDKIEIPQELKFQKLENSKTALICMSDFHAGAEYEISGIYGECVNKYNFDIMKARMWKFQKDFINDNMDYDEICVAILGDAFENILRLSSLTKIKQPVIDTVIAFSEVLSFWLADLQKNTRVPIKVICVGGNHDICRLLGEKPQFVEENLMKIVVEFLKLRLKDFNSIKVADYTEIAVENIWGTNILFEHGVNKNLQQDIEYFSNLYGIDIDEIYAGHFHHIENSSVGITPLGDRMITRVGSICGVDRYSKQTRKSARPSAYVALYDIDGKGWSKNYFL